MPQAQQLGRYHLLDRIAYGGMAEIFRAQTFDGQGNIHLVAIKRLLPHLVSDEEFLEMLQDEARLSALLQHRNIARVYEFGRAADCYYLALEYVDGKDVRALLERARSQKTLIPPEHAAWIAMEAALALHAAHTQRDSQGVSLRIVHRDVSPSNILCSYQGDVKLCDFGIAKATMSRVQTRTGVVKGKVKYMSPEQAMGRRLDHRSDLFSLGTVLFEMLALQPPFQAPTEVELIFAVRDARRRSLQDLAPSCPPDLGSIVDRAMSRSRSARYQSGQELALDLRAFLDAYRPGYRRSHFSRYMQRQFAQEIERETRRLADYTIAEVDESMLGENLLADALGPDAPFTRFTPMNHRWLEVSETTDRHGTPRATQPAHRGPVDTEHRPSPAKAAFHDLKTIVKRPVSFHDAETRLFPLPEANLAAPSLRPGARSSPEPKHHPGERALPRRTLPGGHGAPPVPETVVGPESLNLHDRPTRILPLPEVPTQVVVNPLEPRTPAASPKLSPGEMVVRQTPSSRHARPASARDKTRRTRRSLEDSSFEEEATTVQLEDEDLEPL